MEYKGYTQYYGPEEWLYATYPHLHTVWRQAMASKDITFNMELNCTICKVKPSSGQHYGVKICEADKQFLKRTFHYQLHYPPCIKDGGGVCPPRPRGWCQLCRLRTCLGTPVNIRMIRVGGKSDNGKVKSVKRKKTEEQNPITIQMTIQPNYDFQVPENYSISDWPLAFPPPSSLEYLGYPTTTTPSFYDVPLFNRTPSHTPYDYSNIASSIKEEKSVFVKYDQEIPEAVLADVGCAPLDLSTKPRPVVDDDQWFTDELTFAEFPTKLVYRQIKEEPVDLTTFSSASNSCFSESSLLLYDSSRVPSRSSSPLFLGLDFSKSALSRPSSADGRIRSTPSPSVLEASYGLNKLSVNSTVLGHALSQIQANISVSSLANLSSVSDILTDADK